MIDSSLFLSKCGKSIEDNEKTIYVQDELHITIQGYTCIRTENVISGTASLS